MEDLIRVIKSIGFKEVVKNSGRFNYGRWRIYIRFIDYELTYSDYNPDPLETVEITHKNIQFHDREILKNYFAVEMRENKLNQLGI